MKNQTTLRVRTIFALIATSSMMLLAGCGSSSSGGTPAPPVVVTPTCAAGTNCVLPQNNTNIGFYAQTSNFPTGMYVNNGSNLQEGSQLEALLEEAMGLCNRGAYNGGLAACENWPGGYFDLVFMVNAQNPNEVTLVFRAYPDVGNAWYSYNLPSPQQFFLSFIGFPVAQNSQGVFNPMILTATIAPINASQGFEVRSYGPRASAAYNNMLQLQVANGKIEDQSFGFQLMYRAQPVATGTMVRCQSPTCGL